MNDLENKIVLVTGGAQGIGKGIVMTLANAGANIIIADLNNKKADSVVTELKKLGLGREYIALEFDVTNTTSIQNGVQQALKYFPRIDILVNNAGVGFEEKGLPEEFDLTYEVNLKGVWQVTTALIPHFKTQQAGKIVNIASDAGRKGLDIIPAYGASKAAVINLTQSLAMALGPDNINVNAVCPGLVKTPMTEKYRDETNPDPNYFDAFAEQYTQLKRAVTPEDIGNAVVFLASQSAQNITGQALNVDGGFYMN